MTHRNPLLDRRALFTSGAAAALLAASGVAAGGIPRAGGRLRLALSGASRVDNWVAGNGLFMQVARQGLVFDTLTEVAADGTLRAELATHWTTKDGGLSWTFELRQGVPFHDGSELVAADVVASLAEPLDAKIDLVGKYSVHITLGRPNAGLPLLLSQPEFVIRPAHAPDSGTGTGLYEVKHFEAGRRLLTTRVAKHFKDGSAGWFDEVELTSIPSEPVRVQALGEYLVDAVDVSDGKCLMGLPDVEVSPSKHAPTQAVSHDLGQPALVSNLRPFDNLRAAERWWFT